MSSKFPKASSRALPVAGITGAAFAMRSHCGLVDTNLRAGSKTGVEKSRLAGSMQNFL